MFSVNLWGSKPGTNDDCHTGADFDSLEEALTVFNDPFTTFHGPNQQSGQSYYGGHECWVELDGHLDLVTGDNMMRQIAKGSKRQDDVWQKEQAMEAGMLHGIEAYNDMMGY